MTFLIEQETKSGTCTVLPYKNPSLIYCLAGQYLVGNSSRLHEDMMIDSQIGTIVIVEVTAVQQIFGWLVAPFAQPFEIRRIIDTKKII